MIKQLTLTKALVISTLLHLLLFIMVSVVVAPSLKLTFYPTVSFLGSILNQDSVFPTALANKKLRSSRQSLGANVRTHSLPQRAQVRGSSGWNEIPNHELEAKAGEAPPSFQREPVYIKKTVFFKVRRISFNKKFQIEPEAIFNKSRQQPKYLGRNRALPEPSAFRIIDEAGRYAYKKVQPSRIVCTSDVIQFTGRLKKQPPKDMVDIFWSSPYPRDIIYKPPLPKDRLWTDGTKGDFHLEFEFLISPQGKITVLKKLTSSGVSEVDARAVRYLKKWQFAPSPREQWGRIRLNFEF